MTHEAGRDDGDLEIEEWEQADLELRLQGLSEEERRVIWRALRSPEQIEADELIESFAAINGISEAEAYRVIHSLNGVDI